MWDEMNATWYEAFDDLLNTSGSFWFDDSLFKSQTQPREGVQGCVPRLKYIYMTQYYYDTQLPVGPT